jgi:large subunit ribosomal protein L17
MRHRNTKATLNKPADQRRAMIRSLVDSLFLYGKIQTTNARAKALASEAEKLITKAKRQKEAFNSIRVLEQVLYQEASSKKAMQYIGKTKKTSGFTRSTKIKNRAGDNALLVQVELITE